MLFHDDENIRSDRKVSEKENTNKMHGYMKRILLKAFLKKYLAGYRKVILLNYQNYYVERSN